MDNTQIDIGIDSMRAVTNVDKHGMTKNTPKAYEAKQKEFILFCDTCYPTESAATRHTLDPNKALRFIIYAAFREQKTRGPKRKRKDAVDVLSPVEELPVVKERNVTFDREQYNRIIDCFVMNAEGTLDSKFTDALEPENGVGFNVLNSTKAALKQMWRRQRDNGVNTFSEDIVFGQKFCSVVLHVKQRKSRMDKKNFKEKFDHNSAPMEAVEHISVIDDSFEQFNAGLNAKLSSLQTSISACEAVAQRNAAEIRQIMKGVSENKQIMKDTIATNQQILRKLGQFLLQIGDAAAPMMGGSPIPKAEKGGYVAASAAVATPSPTSRPIPCPTPRSDTYPGYGYRMPPIQSATALWQAWYGVGRYLNKPIPGGVDALVSQRKTHWRKEYENSENRMFSRFKQVIACMKEEKKDKPDLLFLKEMDVLYQTAAKAPSISRFQIVMVERRKRRLAEDAALREVGEVITHTH